MKDTSTDNIYKIKIECSGRDHENAWEVLCAIAQRVSQQYGPNIELYSSIPLMLETPIRDEHKFIKPQFMFEIVTNNDISIGQVEHTNVANVEHKDTDWLDCGCNLAYHLTEPCRWCGNRGIVTRHVKKLKVLMEKRNGKE